MDPDPSQPVDAGPVSNSTASSSKGGSFLVTVILSIVLALAIIFGGWAFMQMQDYKNKSDQKAAVAVEAAKKQQKTELQAQFDEQSKSPNKSFLGSATYGSVTFNYPKTWSAYVDTSSTSEPINAYFHPNEVPGLQGKTAYALRAELLAQDYSQVLKQYNSLVSTGKATATAYVPPNLKGHSNVQPGTLLVGQINSSVSDQSGAILIIKVRDKTLAVSTQSVDYLSDFNKTILPSLSFAP